MRRDAEKESTFIVRQILKGGPELSIGDIIALITIDKLASRMEWLELSEVIRVALRKADPIGQHKANEMILPG